MTTATATRKAAAPVAAPRKLFAHQREGVRWLLDTRNNFADGCRLRGRILADEMGLGKTLTVLTALKVHKTVNPAVKAVCVAPASLLINWRREAAQAGVRLDVLVSNHHSQIPGSIDGPFVLVADEAHAFQNPDSARTKAFLALACLPNCEGVYLLTGTPLKNGRPHNLLPLLQCVNHGIARPAAVRDYLFRYCGPRQVWTGTRYVTTFDGATHLDELHSLCKVAILRRLKADALDLPEKTRVAREVELTAEERREYEVHYNRLREEYKRRLKEGKIKGGGDRLVLLGQLRLAGSVAKAGTAIDLADEVLENGQPVVIFTCFRESADRIARHYGVPVFDGDASPALRQRIVDDFQAGRQKVFVGLCQAGGVGITLHRASTVILVDRPWTPGDAVQVEDRLHRIGQRNACTAVWLQHGVIDGFVDGVLTSKAENIEHVLAGERSALSFASAEDLAAEVLDALGWND